MNTNRLEAFSDGVMAIIITILVLEMKVPKGEELKDLLPILPTFLTYVLSFIYLGIYWNNHHHLWQLVNHVNGKILWANLHLLFWLSLFPFTTGWMGSNHFSPMPVALYGFVLLMASIAWYILARQIVAIEGHDSKIAMVFKGDLKVKVTMLIYISAMALSVVAPIVSCVLYVLSAVLWIVPDKRIEEAME